MTPEKIAEMLELPGRADFIMAAKWLRRLVRVSIKHESWRGSVEVYVLTDDAESEPEEGKG